MPDIISKKLGEFKMVIGRVFPKIGKQCVKMTIMVQNSVAK